MNRINNFNLLRCKLKIKLVINGTPFHYGKALMSYQPLHTVDTVSTGIRAAPVLQDLIELTQKPHVYIDPTMDQGASMTLPFFWYKNWVNVVDKEWASLGQLRLDVIVPLLHANGGTGDVSFSIYAWAEDMQLSVPTTMNITGLVAQTSEFGKGVISKTASSIASAMNMLEDSPSIGPYAKATSMIASTTATVAKQFGYSRPQVLDNVRPVRPTTYGNLSNTDTDEVLQKLTVDSKQELTIDPNTLGLPSSDELTLKSIFTRQSYFTQFQWLPTSIQESILFSVPVTPCLFDYRTSILGDLHLTPMCFAALPFKYWSGSIKFRFQIVASQYHKGRLKIVYDPGTITTSTVEYNVAFTKIIDISSQRDFEINVAWAQDVAFCELQIINALNKKYSTTASYPLNRLHNNGILSVYVVNELTSPAITPTNVSVIVSVSAGDDLKLSVPTSSQLENLSYFTLVTQSGEMCDDCPVMAPEINGITSYNPTSSDHIYDVHFGEAISSFRNLLKRYTRLYTYSVSIGGGSSCRFYSVVHPNYPLYYGPSPTGIHIVGAAPNDKPYNITHNSLLHYLAPAYVAMRGSMRYKVLKYSNIKLADDHMAVTRTNQQYIRFLYTFVNVGLTDQSTIASVPRRNEESLFDGAALNSNDNGTILEYELPFYSKYRFAGAKNTTHATNEISYAQFCHKITGRVAEGSTPSPIVQQTLCFAPGEDFSLFFYTGPPVMFSTIFL